MIAVGKGREVSWWVGGYRKFLLKTRVATGICSWMERWMDGYPASGIGHWMSLGWGPRGDPGIIRSLSKKSGIPTVSHLLLFFPLIHFSSPIFFSSILSLSAILSSSPSSSSSFTVDNISAKCQPPPNTYLSNPFSHRLRLPIQQYSYPDPKGNHTPPITSGTPNPTAVSSSGPGTTALMAFSS